MVRWSILSGRRKKAAAAQAVPCPETAVKPGAVEDLKKCFQKNLTLFNRPFIMTKSREGNDATYRRCPFLYLSQGLRTENSRLCRRQSYGGTGETCSISRSVLGLLSLHKQSYHGYSWRSNGASDRKAGSPLSFSERLAKRGGTL